MLGHDPGPRYRPHSLPHCSARPEEGSQGRGLGKVERVSYIKTLIANKFHSHRSYLINSVLQTK